MVEHRVKPEEGSNFPDKREMQRDALFETGLAR